MYLPDTTQLVIIGGRILIHICLALKTRFLATVLLYLNAVWHYQILLSLLSRKCPEAFTLIAVEPDAFSSLVDWHLMLFVIIYHPLLWVVEIKFFLSFI